MVAAGRFEAAERTTSGRRVSRNWTLERDARPDGLTLLGHRRPWSRLVESKNVRLMPMPGSAIRKPLVRKSWTIEPIRGSARLHFLRQISNALQHPRRLINIIPH